MPCIAKVSLLYSTVSSVVYTIISWKFLGTIIFVHTLTIVSNSFKGLLHYFFTSSRNIPD